jgi:hypothetical protein
MSISVLCQNCQKKLKAKSELAGKRLKCPSCGSLVEIPKSIDNDRLDEEADYVWEYAGYWLAVRTAWGFWVALTRLAAVVLVFDMHRVYERCVAGVGRGHTVKTIPTDSGTVTITFVNGVDRRNLFEQIRDYWMLSKKPIPITFGILLLLGGVLLIPTFLILHAPGTAADGNQRSTRNPDVR